MHELNPQLGCLPGPQGRHPQGRPGCIPGSMPAVPQGLLLGHQCSRSGSRSLPGSLLPNNRSTAWHPGSRSWQRRGAWAATSRPHSSLAVWTLGRQATDCPWVAASSPGLCEPLPALLTPTSNVTSFPTLPSPDGPHPTSLQHVIRKRAHFDLPATSELLRRR